MTYYNKYLVIVLAPLVFMAAVTLLYLLPRYFECCCFRHITAAESARSRMRAWKLFLYGLFLIFP